MTSGINFGISPGKTNALYTDADLHDQIANGDNLSILSKALLGGVQQASSNLISRSVKLLVPGGLITAPADTFISVALVGLTKADPDFPASAVKITQGVGKLVALTFAAGPVGALVGGVNLLMTVVTAFDTAETTAKQKRAREIADHIISMRHSIIEKIEEKRRLESVPRPFIDEDDNEMGLYYCAGAFSFSVLDHGQVLTLLNECGKHQGIDLKSLTVSEIAQFYWANPNICRDWAKVKHQSYDGAFVETDRVKKAVESFYLSISLQRDPEGEVPDEFEDSIYVPAFATNRSA